MITDALGSAHVMVRKTGKVDPNKNLSILIDTYVELHMFLVPILGSAHEKFDVWTGPFSLSTLSKFLNFSALWVPFY